MKRWFKIWLGGIVVMLLLAVVIGLLLGSSYEVNEETTIAAPPKKIHPYVNSVSRWSDQIEAGLTQQDPTVEVKFSGPASGVGSTMHWEGDEIGKGWLAITDSDPNKGVWYEAAVRGDEVNLRGSITYEPGSDGTKVVMNTEGDLPPVIGGYIAAYVEDALKKQLQQTLENLKNEIEK